jgi:radical SAM superfamily enzyme YgiQ (UPF0313 family)
MEFHKLLLAISPYDTNLAGSRGKGVVFPPTQLGALGTFLKDRGGYDVTIETMNAWSWQEVKEFILEKKPDLVGMSCYTYNYKMSIDTAMLIKYLSPRTKVVLGGHHIYEETDKHILQSHPCVDFVVTGEGEHTMLEALGRLNAGQELDGVRGVTFRARDGSIVRNPRRDFEPDIDSFPDIDYSMLECTLIPRTTNTYSEISYFRQLKGNLDMGLVPILISRGCPAKCTFCSAGRVYGKWRMRSVDRILDELERLYREFGFRYFEMQSPTFPQWNRMDKELLRGIVERGLRIQWYGMTRGTNFDDELIDVIRASGCAFLLCGAETGSEELNLRQKKFRKIAKARETMVKLADAGVPCMASFLHNYPDSTREDDIATLKFVKDLSRHGVLSHINRLWIEPNSDLYDQAVERGVLNGAQYWDTPLPVSPRYWDATEREVQTHFMNQLNIRLFFHLNAYGDFFRAYEPVIFEPKNEYQCWGLVNLVLYGMEMETASIYTTKAVVEKLVPLLNHSEVARLTFVELNQDTRLRFSPTQLVVLNKSHLSTLQNQFYNTGCVATLSVDFASYPKGDWEGTMRDYENENLLSVDLFVPERVAGVASARDILAVLYTTDSAQENFSRLRAAFPQAQVRIFTHSNEVAFIKQKLGLRRDVCYVYDHSNRIDYDCLPESDRLALAKHRPDLVVFLSPTGDLNEFRGAFNLSHRLWPQVPMLGMHRGRMFLVGFPEVKESWFRWKLKSSAGEGSDRKATVFATGPVTAPRMESSEEAVDDQGNGSGGGRLVVRAGGNGSTEALKDMYSGVLGVAEPPGVFRLETSKE